MKKISIKLLPALLMVFNCICLTSCINRKTNNMFEGLFVCEKENITYYFKVEEINKKTYELSQGKNVLKDAAQKEKYYKVLLYFVDGETTITYDFVQLQDGFPKTKDVRVEYIDVNKNEVSPETELNEYTIVFNNVVFHFKEFNV